MPSVGRGWGAFHKFTPSLGEAQGMKTKRKMKIIQDYQNPPRFLVPFQEGTDVNPFPLSEIYLHQQLQKN